MEFLLSYSYPLKSLQFQGIAFLCGDVRSARHPQKVLDFAGKTDLEEKQTLAKKLEGSGVLVKGLHLSCKAVLFPTDP